MQDVVEGRDPFEKSGHQRDEDQIAPAGAEAVWAKEDIPKR